MRNTILGLLVTILILTIINLLAGFGIVGGKSASSGSGDEYKVLNSAMMDNIGFRAVAASEGIEVPEDGKIVFPKEMQEKIFKVNLLPATIMEVEKDGGWEFTGVTTDNHYLFRRAK